MACEVVCPHELFIQCSYKPGDAFCDWHVSWDVLHVCGKMPITHFLKKEKGRRTAHTENTASSSVLLLLISPEGFVQRASDVKKKQNKLRRWPWRKQPKTITFMFWDSFIFWGRLERTKTPHTLRLSPHLRSRPVFVVCMIKTPPTLQNSLIFTFRLKIQWTCPTWLINLPTTTTTIQSKDKDLQKTGTVALCLQLRTRWSWRWLAGGGDRCSLPHRCPK